MQLGAMRHKGMHRHPMGMHGMHRHGMGPMRRLTPAEKRRLERMKNDPDMQVVANVERAIGQIRHAERVSR